jgi:hypothetical protein
VYGDNSTFSTFFFTLETDILAFFGRRDVRVSLETLSFSFEGLPEYQWLVTCDNSIQCISWNEVGTIIYFQIVVVRRNLWVPSSPIHFSCPDLRKILLVDSLCTFSISTVIPLIQQWSVRTKFRIVSLFLLAFVFMGLPDFESKCTSSRPPTKSFVPFSYASAKYCCVTTKMSPYPKFGLLCWWVQQKKPDMQCSNIL